MTDNPLHSTASNEHYTPSLLVEPARYTLGEIDLDPASCELANQTVRAKQIFTRDDNGFQRDWHGRVFHNPPGGSCDDQGRLVIKKSKGRGPCTETGDCGLPPGAAGHRHEHVTSSQKAWWRKLGREYVAERTSAAIFICFSLELIQTTQVEAPSDALFPVSFPVCFPAKRVPYNSEKNGVLQPGTQPTHASMVVFLPPADGYAEAVARFEEAFSPIGIVISGQRVVGEPKPKIARVDPQASLFDLIPQGATA